MLVVREDIAAQLNLTNDKIFRVARENENFKANIGASSGIIDSQNDKIFELEKVAIYLKKHH